jgi:hypothetical protein
MRRQASFARTPGIPIVQFAATMETSEADSSASDSPSCEVQPRTAAVRLDARDIHTARQLGLLCADVDVCADEKSDEFGCAYEQAASLCASSFDDKSALQARCREFARTCGFSIRVASNSYSSKKNEGNAKYVCKKLKGRIPARW